MEQTLSNFTFSSLNQRAELKHSTDDKSIITNNFKNNSYRYSLFQMKEHSDVMIDSKYKDEKLIKMAAIKSKHLKILMNSVQQSSISPPQPRQAFEVYHYSNREELTQEEQHQKMNKLIEDTKRAITQEYNHLIFQEEMEKLKLQQFIIDNCLRIEENQQQALKEKIQVLTYKSMPKSNFPQFEVKKPMKKDNTLVETEKKDSVKQIQKKQNKICPFEVICWQTQGKIPQTIVKVDQIKKEVNKSENLSSIESKKNRRVKDREREQKKSGKESQVRRKKEKLAKIMEDILSKEKMLKISEDKQASRSIKRMLVKDISLFWQLTQQLKERQANTSSKHVFESKKGVSPKKSKGRYSNDDD